MKKIKKMLALALVLVSLLACFPAASASAVSNDPWPAVSRSAYLEMTCPVSRLNVYTTPSMTTRGVSAPTKQAYNAYAEKGDKLCIYQFSGSAVLLSYPAGSIRKEGWASVKDLFGVSKPTAVATASAKETTYTYASTSSTAGYIAKGDRTYSCGVTNGYTLTIYEARSGSRAWKAAYTAPKLTAVIRPTIVTIVTPSDDHADLSVTNRAKENGIRVSNAEESRSAANYNAVIDQYTVTSNSRYKRTSTATWCNIFAWDVTRALGCEIPHWTKNNAPVVSFTSGAREMTANLTYNWLRDYGEDYGWSEVFGDEAQQRANEGYPTVAVWYNSTGKSGHIAVVRPEGNGFTYSSSRGPVIAQAGASNYDYTNVRTGFGRTSGVVYYTHN